MIVIPILVVGVSVRSLSLAHDLALRAAGYSRVAEMLSLLNNSRPVWQRETLAAVAR